MAKKKAKNIKLFIDGIGNTMHLWWDDPRHAVRAEESDQGLDVILYNRKGQPIGLEKLGVFPKEVDPLKRRLFKAGEGTLLTAAVR